MFKLMGRVANILLRNMIAPIVAKTGGMDEAVKLLKQTPVDLLISQTDASKSEVGKHLGKSERWVYIQCKNIKKRKKTVMAGEIRPIIYDIMNYFYGQAPNDLSSIAVLAKLKKTRLYLTQKAVDAALKRCVSLGFIETVQSCEDLFRVLARTTTIHEDGLDERLERIGRTSKNLVPAAMAYARGDADARFGSSRLNVDAEEWLAFVKDVQRYIGDRGHQAVVNSVEKDPSEITSEPHTVIFAAALLDSEDE